MSELYLFERGTTKWAYTNGLDSVSFGGDTYLPADIAYPRVEISNDVFRNNISLSIDLSEGIVSAAFDIFSTNYCTVKIYRDSVLWWAGRVTGITIQKDKAVLKCESIYNSKLRSGVRNKFEKFCRHPHYGPDCGLDKETYKSGPYEILTIVDNIVTIEPGEPSSDSVFKFGMMYNSVDYTTIVSKTGDACKVINTMSLAVGQDIYLYKGCLRNKTTCILRFNNYRNFGGLPWMPSSNAFEVGIL